MTDLRGEEQAQTLRGFGHGWQGQQNDTNAVYVKGKRAQSDQDDESWREDSVHPTVNAFDVGDARATALVRQEWVGALRANSGGWRPRAEEHPDMTVGPIGGEDDLLPLKLDSNRYRACGNAVVVNVAEWLGHRIRLAAEGKI